jgi:hypothetical protein
MDSSSCGSQEKGCKTVAGEIFSSDGQRRGEPRPSLFFVPVLSFGQA